MKTRLPVCIGRVLVGLGIVVNAAAVVINRSHAVDDTPLLKVVLWSAAIGAFAGLWVLGMNYQNPHCSERFFKAMCALFGVAAGLVSVLLALTSLDGHGHAELLMGAPGLMALTVMCLIFWEVVETRHKPRRF
jgi:succinate dehydrogenase hydrophobic anchor subunit